MPIGIYGGTFDPIHCGHLLLAEWTRIELNLDKIIFVPALIPPHKQQQTITAANLRLQMVQLAIQDNPHFETSTIELEKKETSYSIFTILEFRKIYNLAQDQLHLLIGADSMLDFHKWHQPDQILRNCQVVVYRRYNCDYSQVSPDYLDQVILLNNPIIDLSSNKIRERSSLCKSIKYMVPPVVEKFIFHHGLYKKIS